MEEKSFFVHTGTQSPIRNKMLRAADMIGAADGAVICDGSGYEVAITWKDGEIVDDSRIEKARQNLRAAYESLGFYVLDIILQK